MNRNKIIEKMDSERAKYKVKCSCGHSIVFFPNHPRNKLICSYCGHYVYKNEKEKFKELMKGSLKNES